MPGRSEFSEKLGLNVEPVTQPDKAVAAFQASVDGLKSALAFDEQIATPAPEKLPAASQWKKRFIWVWDGNKGSYFDGVVLPAIDGDYFGAYGERGDKCVLLFPMEGGVENAHGMAFNPDPGGRTPNDFYDYPDSAFVLRR